MFCEIYSIKYISERIKMKVFQLIFHSKYNISFPDKNYLLYLSILIIYVLLFAYLSLCSWFSYKIYL